MEPCTRCGATDEHRMIALMSRWFAVHAGLAPDHGYFYLCPACYDERIEPEFETIVAAIREHQKPDRVAAHEAPAAEGAAATGLSAADPAAAGVAGNGAALANAYPAGGTPDPAGATPDPVGGTPDPAGATPRGVSRDRAISPPPA